MLRSAPFLFFSLLVLSGLVRAEEGFFQIADFARHPDRQAIERAAAASVNFVWNAGWMSPGELDGTQPVWGGCSAQFISNEGHLLTALHCLRKPFGREPFKAVVGAAEKRDSEGGNSWMQYEHQSPQNLFLKDAVVVFPSGKVHRGAAQIVAIGKGWPYRLVSEKAVAESAKIYTLDFAILKFDLTGEFPCMEVSRAVKPTDRIYSIGYPSEVDRPNSKPPTGLLSITQGEVISGVQVLRSFAQKSPEAISNMNSVYASGITIGTTADGAEGQSGGMVINRQGKMVGVLTLSFYPGALPPGAQPLTAAVSISAIQDELSRVLGAERVAALFKCEKE